MDNYFSGDKVLDWIGQNSFEATMTCCCDRLPTSVPTKYWHSKQKTDGSKKSKVACFFNSLVAVENVTSKDENIIYLMRHVKAILTETGR